MAYKTGQEDQSALGLEDFETVKEITAFSQSSPLAYIRPALKGAEGYAVCSSDGKELAVFSNYDAAFFTARQYNLLPVNVH